MKATIRVPTVQYGFIEYFADAEPEEIAEMSKHLNSLQEEKVGLSAKDFNKFLDRYLTDATGELETFNEMSEEQKGVIQEIKKAYKRLNK